MLKFQFIFLLLLSAASYALPDDREKVLELQADKADLSQQKHKGIYIGNVALNQGTTHLRAEKAETLGDAQNKLIKAAAFGKGKKQAHFWTLSSLEKPELHAYADSIFYYPNEHRILLVGNARVSQGDDSFAAPKIVYDSLHEHVITEHDKESRTTIIIHPEKKHE